MNNADFISFMFDNVPEGATPVGCSFSCSPEDTTEFFKYKWAAQPLIVGADPMVKGQYGTAGKFTPETNNYVSVSSFLPDYKRRDSNFAALHALMIDDVGTKVPVADITLMPSVVVETSPGNLQCWYKLDKPVASLEHATMLINAMVAKLRHDASLATRLGRLPVGSNTKKDPPFQQIVRSAELHRYSVSDIVKAYDLKLVKPAPQNVVPHPKADKVARWLHENGYVKFVKSNGWIVLHCPFGGHDDNDGTGYQPPTPSNPNGHFRCLHAKCKGRGTSHLIDFITQVVRQKAGLK